MKPEMDEDFVDVDEEDLYSDAQDEQETRDTNILCSLLDARFPYRKASLKPDVAFSWTVARVCEMWLLSYRQARMAGIACMLTSCDYGIGRVGAKDRHLYGQMIQIRHDLLHNPHGRSRDCEILYRAQQRLNNLRRASRRDVQLAVKTSKQKKGQ